MSRPLDASTDTAIAETATQPYYLFKLQFTTVAYLSSVQEISWDSKTWLASSVQFRDGHNPTITIFNEGLSLGHTILGATLSAGRTVDVWKGYQNDSAHPNPYPIFSGEMGEVNITQDIVIRCRRYPPEKSPRHFAVPPLCNHLPRNGTRFDTPNGPVILETR